MALATEEAGELWDRAGEPGDRLVARAVRAAQEGDRQALGFLYARYAQDVHRYARSIVGCEHDAEDVTQQVFAKLLRQIGKYQPRGVPFIAWLLRVARNTALDHIRQRREVPVAEVAPAGQEEDIGSRRARLAELRGALAALPGEQRRVLLLRHLAGLSPVEIAELTGRSESSIHGLHNRGRRTIRAELLECGLGPAVARETGG